MKFSEYDPAAPPVERAEVTWFTAELLGDWACLREHRAIFYGARLSWSDHPWSKGSPGGCDFLNQWTLESRSPGDTPWRGEGRSGYGWSALAACRPVRFDTLVAAAEHLLCVISDRKCALVREIGELDRQQARVSEIAISLPAAEGG